MKSIQTQFSMSLCVVALLCACGGDSSNQVIDMGARTDTGVVTDLGTGTDTGVVTDSGAGTDSGMSAICPMTSCDLISNSGCGSTERCSVTSSTLPVMTSCITAGTGGQSATCTDDTGCMAGYICITNQCLHMCCTGSTAGECGAGYVCDREITLGGEHSGVGICDPTDSCDLPAQTGCGAGETCNLLNGGGDRLCRTASGALTEGTACEPANDQCALGLQCLQIDSGAALCRKFCDATATSPCNGSDTCGRIVVTGMADLGVCRPPA